MNSSSPPYTDGYKLTFFLFLLKMYVWFMVWNDRSIIKRVQQVLLACTERGQYDPGEGPKGQFTGRNSHPIDAGTENYHMGAGVNKKTSESWPGDMTKCICTCQWYRYIYIDWLWYVFWAHLCLQICALKYCQRLYAVCVVRLYLLLLFVFFLASCENGSVLVWKAHGRVWKWRLTVTEK